MFMKMTAKSKLNFQFGPLFKNGAIGQNTLKGFLSGALGVHGPGWPFGCGVPMAWLFLWSLLFVERFVYWKSYDPLESVRVLHVDWIAMVVFFRRPRGRRGVFASG